MATEIKVGTLSVKMNLDTSELPKNKVKVEQIINALGKSLTAMAKSVADENIALAKKDAAIAVQEVKRKTAETEGYYKKLDNLAKARFEKQKGLNQQEAAEQKKQILELQRSVSKTAELFRKRDREHQQAIESIRQETAALRAMTAQENASAAASRVLSAEWDKLTTEVKHEIEQERSYQQAARVSISTNQIVKASIDQKTAKVREHIQELKIEEAQLRQNTALENKKARTPFAEMFKHEAVGRIAGIVGDSALRGGLGLGAGLVMAGKASMDFKRQMREVAANTHMTTEQMEMMRKSVLKLGDESGGELQKIARGYQNIADFGYRAEEAEKILHETMKQALPTGADLAKSSELVASTMHTMKIKSEDAARVVNVLSEATAVSSATFEDFAESVQPALTTAGNYGATLIETTAALAAFTRGGLNAAKANTAFDGVLRGIVNPTVGVHKLLVQLTEKLKKAGVTTIDLVHNFSTAGLKAKGLGGVLEELKITADKLGYSYAEMATKVFSAKHGRYPAFVLMKSGADDFAQSLTKLEKAWDEASRTQQDYEKYLQSVESKMGQVRNTFVETSDVVLTTLGPAFTSLLQKIKELFKWFQSLPKGTQENIVQFAALSAGGLVLVGTFAKIIQTIAELKASMAILGLSSASLGARFSGMANVIVAAISKVPVAVSTALAAVTMLAAAQKAGGSYDYRPAGTDTEELSERQRRLARSNQRIAEFKKTPLSFKPNANPADVEEAKRMYRAELNRLIAERQMNQAEVNKYKDRVSVSTGKTMNLSAQSGVNTEGLTMQARERLMSLDATMSELRRTGVITSAKRNNFQFKSNHNSGNAIDLVSGTAKEMKELASILKKRGFSAQYETKGQKNKNGSVATGNHIHVNLNDIVDQEDARAEVPKKPFGGADELWSMLHDKAKGKGRVKVSAAEKARRLAETAKKRAELANLELEKKLGSLTEDPVAGAMRSLHATAIGFAKRGASGNKISELMRLGEADIMKERGLQKDRLLDDILSAEQARKPFGEFEIRKRQILREHQQGVRDRMPKDLLDKRKEAQEKALGKDRLEFERDQLDEKKAYELQVGKITEQQYAEHLKTRLKDYDAYSKEWMDKAKALYDFEKREMEKYFSESEAHAKAVAQIKADVDKMTLDEFQLRRKEAQENLEEGVWVDAQAAAERYNLTLQEIDKDEREARQRRAAEERRLAEDQIRYEYEIGDKSLEEYRDFLKKKSQQIKEAQKQEEGKTFLNEKDKKDQNRYLQQLQNEYQNTQVALQELEDEDVQHQLAMNKISLKEYKEYLKKKLDALKKNSKASNQVEEEVKRINIDQWRTIATTMSDMFTNAFKDMLTGSKGFFESLTDAFTDMVTTLIAKWLAMQAVMGILSLFGGGGGLFSDIFGGVGGFLGFDDASNDRKARHWGYDFASMFTGGADDYVNHSYAQGTPANVNTQPASMTRNINVNIGSVHGTDTHSADKVAKRIAWQLQQQLRGERI